MTRVPTYSSNMNFINQTLRNKTTFDLYNFQTMTGLKAPTYSGYGMKAYNIVSLEASLNVTSTFLQNNEVVALEANTMNLSLDSTYKAANSFKSMLLSFSGAGLNNITPDYTGGKIQFTNNTVADYMNSTITIESTQYTFTNNNTGNNIDISAATNAQDVMTALQAKVGALNPDFVFNADTFEFPLYTVNGTSSVLDVTGVETGTPKLMTPDQYQSMQQLQNLAFSTLKIITDNLNVSTNGKYLFGGGVANEAPISFPFKNLEEFQKYYDGVNIAYPTNASADLSNRTITAANTGALTLERTSANGNDGKITATNIGAFLTEAISANPATTGNLTFDSAENTITATEYGAFNNFKAGDTMVIGGNVNALNAKAYTIKSVSADGKKITVEPTTPIGANETVSPVDDVKLSTSFPVGSVIKMDGFGNNISPTVQVTGISDDGTELYVTVDPSRFPAQGSPVTVATTNWSMYSESYYRGGDLVSEKMISDNQSITFDVHANDPAFEKLFRALGMIAQGNLVDTRNPKDSLNTLIDPNHAKNVTQEAVNLLYDALFSPQSTEKNPDLYSVMAKTASNTIVIKNTMDNQELVQLNLENDIYGLKNVDKEEAAAKSLMAKTNLEASYSVLQQALSLTFLNYMK